MYLINIIYIGGLIMTWKNKYIYRCTNSSCEKSKKNFRTNKKQHSCNECRFELELIKN